MRHTPEMINRPEHTSLAPNKFKATVPLLPELSWFVYLTAMQPANSRHSGASFLCLKVISANISRKKMHLIFFIHLFSHEGIPRYSKKFLKFLHRLPFQRHTVRSSCWKIQYVSLRYLRTKASMQNYSLAQTHCAINNSLTAKPKIWQTKCFCSGSFMD